MGGASKKNKKVKIREDRDDSSNYYDDFSVSASKNVKKTIELNSSKDYSADEYTLPKDDATSFRDKASLPSVRNRVVATATAQQ